MVQGAYFYFLIWCISILKKEIFTEKNLIDLKLTINSFPFQEKTKDKDFVYPRSWIFILKKRCEV